MPLDPPGLTQLLGRGRGTISELLSSRVAATPDRLFLLWEGSHWSYSEALDQVQRFAGWVLAEPSSDGAPEDRRVASFLPNRPETLWCWLGTLVAGAVYVPLNRSHRGSILHDMIARSGADVLVTDGEGLSLLPDLDGTSVRTVLLVDGKSEPKTALRVAGWEEVASSEPSAGPLRSPSDVAEVMYTSGTTGRSKAVLLLHNQLVRGAAWVAWSLELTEEDVLHAWLPLFHIGGQLDAVLAFIVAGGGIALQPTFSRRRFWEQVAEAEATVFIGFSNVLEILWAEGPRENDRGCTLRAAIAGGVPPKIQRPFEERFGLRLFDVFGMTEAEPMALPAPGTMPPVGAAGPASPDFELAIVDESGLTLDAGEVGHLVVRPRVPDVMFLTYEDDELAYREAVRGLWFRTGDLGRIDEHGNFFFLDRDKHAIRRRGENISSFELERLVLEHDDVSEICAVGVPSPLGEDDVKIVVAPAPGADLDCSLLREWCAERMAAFMVPRYIEVVAELPRNPTGKVNKQELAEVGADVFDAEAQHRGGRG